jgi:hypothetical protein
MSIYLADIFADMQELMVIVLREHIILLGAILLALMLFLGLFVAFWRVFETH